MNVEVSSVQFDAFDGGWIIIVADNLDGVGGLGNDDLLVKVDTGIPEEVGNVCFVGVGQRGGISCQAAGSGSSR